jgi:hypothetical protein
VDDQIADLYNLDVRPVYSLKDFMINKRDLGWKDQKTQHIITL